jgi:hypothetical protein
VGDSDVRVRHCWRGQRDKTKETSEEEAARYRRSYPATRE